MSGGRGWLRRIATVALVAAAVAFIARSVFTNSRDLATFDWRVRPWVLALSTAAHVAVLAWGVLIWSRVLRHFGVKNAPFAALLRIWALSNAFKYVPGKVWQFLTAARLATSSGLPQVVTLSSMLVHVLLSLAAGCVLAVATLPLTELGVSAELVWLLRIGVPAAAAVGVHPGWINLGLRLVPKALHREVLAWNASWIDGLALLALAVVSWMFYGIAFFLFLLSLAPVPLDVLPAAAGINALSFVAGMAAILAPAGLGVKEWAMTLLLAPVLPVGVAAVVAVGARLWSVAADVALAGLALLLRTRDVPAAETRPPV
ncbi:MAG: hypothetical protein KY464_06615 [Gemmatimonadetes bacterium]|nr:hypothetical protein [Gemmatimonadota bacterium]